MLVISRLNQQSFFIHLPDGRSVRVQLVSASGGRASIGIDAPPDIGIVRAEIDGSRYMKLLPRSPATSLLQKGATQ